MKVAVIVAALPGGGFKVSDYLKHVKPDTNGACFGGKVFKCY